MKSTIWATVAILSAVLLGITPACADGDAVLGKKVFNRCAACHEIKTERDKVGPHLLGVFGRAAGSLESYAAKYSDPMKQAGADGLIWDEASLADYLRAPAKMMPGNKMTFAGMTKDEDIANVIAYLKADPKP